MSDIPPMPQSPNPTGESQESRQERWRRMLEETEVERTVVQKADGVPEDQMMMGWGKTEYDAEGGLILYFARSKNEEAKPLIIYPKGEYKIGRREVTDDDDLDLNMAPYGGAKQGISRVHASLKVNDNRTLSIIDLGSTNGTFINEVQLEPNQPRVLRSGDSVRLGQVVFHVFFK